MASCVVDGSGYPAGGILGLVEMSENKVGGTSPSTYLDGSFGMCRPVAVMPQFGNHDNWMGISQWFSVAAGLAMKGFTLGSESEVASTVGEVSTVNSDETDSLAESVTSYSVVSGSYPELGGEVQIVPEEVPGVVPAVPLPFSAGPGVLRDVLQALTEAAPLVEEYPPGQCYLTLIADDYKEAAVEALGNWPTVGEIVLQPLVWLTSWHELSKVGVLLREGTLHFQSSGGDGMLAAVDLIAVARKASAAGVYTPEIQELLAARVGGSHNSALRRRDREDKLVEGFDYEAEIEGVRICCDHPACEGNGAMRHCTMQDIDQDNPFSEPGPGVTANGDGYCYLDFFTPQGREHARASLGFWPTVGQLLSAPAAWAVYFPRHSSLVATGDARYWHYSKHDVTGAKQFIPALQQVVLRDKHLWPEGSIGWSLSTYGVTVAPEPLDLDRNSRLGGSSALGAWLADVVDAPGWQPDPEDILLVGQTVGLLSGAAKTRYKMLAVVGDNAFSLIVSLQCIRAGKSVADYQGHRSAATSNSSLSAAFAEYVPEGAVTYLAGVSPGVGKVGATSLEAMAGLVYLSLSLEHVERFFSALGLCVVGS